MDPENANEEAMLNEEADAKKKKRAKSKKKHAKRKHGATPTVTPPANQGDPYGMGNIFSTNGNPAAGKKSKGKPRMPRPGVMYQ